ncbi:MAG TPA: FAD-dependent oxidoreductase [Polyangiaceae bacterium]|nr:FAD-dependent oxidoreductase [Polyangiaceae bacterium]
MDVVIVGDGPGGLSAALFLAKAGLQVTVYGQDKTAMHWALLRNYLGIPEIHGSEFQKRARAQAEGFGARLVDARVESVEKTADGFRVTLEGGEAVAARFLVLSEGKSPRLADQLGLTRDGSGAVVTDIHARTSLEGVYAVGRLARPERSQAIISAGDGASAAIDIVSSVRGAPYTDWDSPPENG